MSPAPSPPAMLGAVGPDAHIDDQRYLRARLVALCFNRAFDADTASVWHAPSTLVLLGGRRQGPSLSLATHWRAMVAARAREDRALRIHLLGSGDETTDLTLDDEGTDADAPKEAASIAAVVRTLARRGHLDCGLDLLRVTDVPTGVGLGVDASVRAAVAWAVSGLSARSGSGPALSPAELVTALDEASGSAADHQVCVSTAEGYVALARPGALGEGSLHEVRLDAAHHGFRLVLVTLRVPPGSPAPTVWEPAVTEDALAEEGFGLFASSEVESPVTDLPQRVGSLLDASHAAAIRQRAPVVTDRFVIAARAAGALGARAVSSRAMLAAVATTQVATVRRAVLAACGEQPETHLGARFLTTAGVAGAGQGAREIEGFSQ
ncbi:MAG: hypothetical protein ACRDZ8_22015 [Acidimicrobiales bacterium]